MDKAFALKIVTKKNVGYHFSFKDSKVYSFVNFFHLFRISSEKETRSRFQFSFPDPDLSLLQDFATHMEDLDGFRKRYGNLLSLMKV